MGQVATTESNLFYYSKRLSSLTENIYDEIVKMSFQTINDYLEYLCSNWTDLFRLNNLSIIWI